MGQIPHHRHKVTLTISNPKEGTEKNVTLDPRNERVEFQLENRAGQKFTLWFELGTHEMFLHIPGYGTKVEDDEVSTPIGVSVYELDVPKEEYDEVSIKYMLGLPGEAHILRWSNINKEDPEVVFLYGARVHLRED